MPKSAKMFRGPNVRSLTSVRARLTKIHDFVPFGTRQMPDKPFLEFFFESVGKLSVKNFRGPRALGKKLKNRKKIYFFARNPTFSG